jgi:hypothetical protein
VRKIAYLTFPESPEDATTKARAATVQRSRDRALRQEGAFIETDR